MIGCGASSALPAGVLVAGVLLGCTSPRPARAPYDPELGDWHAQADGAKCGQGKTTACADLGWMYETGTGIRRDYARAAAAYTRACGLPDGADSCASLGLLHERGHLGPADPARALAIYRDGCDKGGAGACARAAEALRGTPGSGAFDRRACALDAARQSSCARACAHGDPGACNAVAATQKDPARAAELHAFACEGGFARGCFETGRDLLEGRGVAKDPPAGVQALEAGCANGSGCRELAHAVERGAAGPPSWERASDLLSKACSLGDTGACVERVILLASLSNADEGAFAAAAGSSDRTTARIVALASDCLGDQPEACAALVGEVNSLGAPPIRAFRLNARACAAHVERGCEGLRYDFAAKRVPSGGEESLALVLEPCAELAADCAHRWSAEAARASASRRALLHRLACDAGDLRACSLLSAELGPFDDDEPAALARQSCDGGDALGCLAMGDAYRRGTFHRGTPLLPKSPALAAKAYARACDGGELRACDELADMLDHAEWIDPALDAKGLHARACSASPDYVCAEQQRARERAALLTRLFECRDETHTAKTYLSIGGLLSVPLHDPVGYGVEASIVHFGCLDLLSPFVGGFFQASSAGGDHARLAFGPELGFSVIGLEAGYAWEDAGQARAATHFLHLAPIVALGFVNAAFRWQIPLGASGEAREGSFAIVVTAKVPFPLDGRFPSLLPPFQH